MSSESDLPLALDLGSSREHLLTIPGNDPSLVSTIPGMDKMRGTFPKVECVRTRQVGSILLHMARFARIWVTKNFARKAVFRDFFAVFGFLAGVGTGRVMAKIIEFYVPNRFRPTTKWVPPIRRGHVIEFYIPKKSA